jgi:hypothetical protein
VCGCVASSFAVAAMPSAAVALLVCALLGHSLCVVAYCDEADQDYYQCVSARTTTHGLSILRVHARAR